MRWVPCRPVPLSLGASPFGPVAPGVAREDEVSPFQPRLGALAYNGGPTQTLLPAAGSPAIGHIPTNTTLNGVQVCPSVDQRGVASVGNCTIGAVEVAIRPSITKISPTSGPPAGGTKVSITGTGFTGATKVAFGTIAATTFSVVSSTTITAVSPAQAASTQTSV